MTHSSGDPARRSRPDHIDNHERLPDPTRAAGGGGTRDVGGRACATLADPRYFADRDAIADVGLDVAQPGDVLVSIEGGTVGETLVVDENWASSFRRSRSRHCACSSRPGLILGTSAHGCRPIRRRSSSGASLEDRGSRGFRSRISPRSPCPSHQSLNSRRSASGTSPSRPRFGRTAQ